MKSIKDLRESYNLITEKEEHDMNKLTQLVRAGLFDAKKLSALKRAMDKPADKMTAQEKRMLINLLDALMSEVLSDKQVYRKIKQDVMMKEAKDYFATPDPRVQRFGYPSHKEAPSVLLLKRKAIRVFPDGQKVALYYAQAIDKYVSIPYGEIGISEEIELDENRVLNAVRRLGQGISNTISSFSGGGSENKKEKEKDTFLEPLKRDPAKLKISFPTDKERDDENPSSLRTRLRTIERRAAEEQGRMRESFQNKLEVLREDDIDSYENRMTAGLGGFTPYGGGRFGGGWAKTNKLDSKNKVWIDPKLRDINTRTGEKIRLSGSTKIEPKPSGPPGRPRLPPVRRRRDRDPDPRDPGRYTPAQPKREREDKPPPVKKPDDKPVKKPDDKPVKKPDDKKKPEKKLGKKPGAGAAGAAAAGAFALGSLSGKSDDSNKLEPLRGSAKLNVVSPKREGDPSSLGTQLNIISRKAAEAMSRQTNESINLDGNIFELNNRAAEKVTALYESLNKKNKKKMVEMMSESAESLEKVISFAVRQ